MRSLRSASAAVTYALASRAAPSALSAFAVTSMTFVWPSGLIEIFLRTSVAVIPPPITAAVRTAASRVSSTAAAVWIVRVGSADSRSTSMPMKASFVAGSGEASSVEVAS